MDLRRDAARFYDWSPTVGKDVGFYRSILAAQRGRRLLELGCGTGRVLLSLLPDCEEATGVDSSEGMLTVLREKLADLDAGADHVTLVNADICSVDLQSRFDLIIAPGRVFQNLETDTQVDGVFAVIRRHLSPGGSCVLTAYNPNSDRNGIISAWSAADPDVETQTREVPYRDGTLRHSHRRIRFTTEPLVLYSELIARYREGEREVDCARFISPMRVYYPDELLQTVTRHGFRVVDKWGGYAGETYGDGPELVVRFTAEATDE